jgi:hypothetical protein
LEPIVGVERRRISRQRNTRKVPKRLDDASTRLLKFS